MLNEPVDHGGSDGVVTQCPPQRPISSGSADRRRRVHDGAMSGNVTPTTRASIMPPRPRYAVGPPADRGAMSDSAPNTTRRTDRRASSKRRSSTSPTAVARCRLPRPRTRGPAVASVIEVPLLPLAIASTPSLRAFDAPAAFFSAAIDGVSDLGADVVVTLGPTGDPLSLGPRPSNVLVERFVPQEAILRHCRAVVTNGGSGSVIGALAHGVPVLCGPAAASPSQRRNADAVVRAGAGLSIERGDAGTAAGIRAAVSALLEDSSYANVAGRLADEIEQMPPVAEGVTLLERLVAERRPLTA